MKKRIGTKIYDTDKGIPVIPEIGLYKQPLKKTFYLFDGGTITPLSFEETQNVMKGAGRDDLLSMLKRSHDAKGVTNLRIKAESVDKLAAYSRAVGRSMKSIIEDYIDSLSIEK